MNNKRFFTMIAVALAVILGGAALLNLFVDPFGIFGDPIYHWDTYNFTQNPRTAKINWLDRREGEFDAFVIGSSGASAINPKTLERTLGGRWYNCFFYGSDLLDSYQTIRHLTESGKVRRIFLGLNYNTAMKYDEGEDSLNYKMPVQATGGSKFSYYRDFLFANPNYPLGKIRDWKKNSYFQQSFSVFLPETGVYDKRLRDTENIGPVEEYEAKEEYSLFGNYPKEDHHLTKMKEFKECMEKILSLCEERNVTLDVAVLPMYHKDFLNFHEGEIREFYRTLVGLTDFWDFTKSRISTDPRYFYDPTHYRNSVGDMVVSKMYGDGSLYMPHDFGHFVTSENLEDFLRGQEEKAMIFNDTGYTRKVPILMMHHLGEGEYAISPDQFRRQMTLLKEKGYTTVSLKELEDYVFYGKDLPEKPLVLTFDDGYASNYTEAYPVLKELGMKATIFIIGHSVGKDTYKDTGAPILPHFSEEEGREMVESKVMDIQSHTYDMHQSEALEPGEPVRKNVAPFKGEKEMDYIRAFQEDFHRENALIHGITGKDIHAFAYPTGYYSRKTEALLGELGVKATLTSDPGTNLLIKGLPQSLFGLKRLEVQNTTTDEQLLEKIKE